MTQISILIKAFKFVEFHWLYLKPLIRYGIEESFKLLKHRILDKLLNLVTDFLKTDSKMFNLINRFLLRNMLLQEFPNDLSLAHYYHLIYITFKCETMR